jgi:hypothetical protein
MFEESKKLIETQAPCDLIINGIRSVDAIIAHYEGLGFKCEVMPENEDYIKILKVS